MPTNHFRKLVLVFAHLVVRACGEVDRSRDKHKHLRHLSANKKARSEFVTAAASYILKCSAAAVRSLGIEPAITGEHADATANTAALCGQIGLERGLECQPTALMYTLHQLSLAAGREAKLAGCCPRPSREVLRHVFGSRAHSSGKGDSRRRKKVDVDKLDDGELARFPLALADTLHGLALLVAQEEVDKTVRASRPMEEQTEIDRYAQFILNGNSDGSWERYREKSETEAAVDANLAGVILPGCFPGERLDDTVAVTVIGKDPTIRIDVDGLRREYEKNGGWIVVPDALELVFAEALRTQLHDMPVEAWHATIWSLKRGELKLELLDRPQKIPNVPENSKKIVNGHLKSDAARDLGDFSYHYLRTGVGKKEGPHFADPFANVTISSHLKQGRAKTSQCPHTPGHLVPGPLCDLEVAMASAAFRAMVSNITGVDVGTQFQDFMASWFRPGDYLTSHADALDGRRIAFRIGLTLPEWKDGWGGDLVFEDRSRAKGARLIGSKFNELLLFDVQSTQMEHYVSEVELGSAGYKRLAVTGWYE